MNLFKKKLSYDSYLEMLISEAIRIKEDFKKEILESNPKANIEVMEFDTLIFGLWVVSLYLDSKKIKDDFYDLAFNKYLTDEQITSRYINTIELKYKNLFYAHNIWVKDAQAGIMAGDILYRMFVNQQEDLDAENLDLLENPGIFKATSYFTFFATILKISLMFKEYIQKNYKIQYN